MDLALVLQEVELRMRVRRRGDWTGRINDAALRLFALFQEGGAAAGSGVFR